MENRAAAGIAFITAGIFCISINDMLIKELSGGYPLHQMVFVRSAIGICFGLIFVQLEGGFSILRTSQPWLHAFRGLLIVAANMTYFAALAALPLADATALFFVAPLFITLLSIPVLATLILYRPPRMIRVYPGEAVAQTSRGLFGKPFWVRWHDLSQSSLKVERTRVITGQSASGGAVAVGCLLSLLGPLGLIAMLAFGLASGKKEYATAFALIDDQRPARPLAVFLKRSDAQKLATISSSIGLGPVGTSGSP